MLTTIRSKTISAALLRCVNRFFRRVSGELPSIIRRTLGDPPADFRQTLGLATIHLASSDELLWQASGLLGFVPAEPPMIVRTSVELSNSQRDHCHDSGATPAACLTFIVVNLAYVKIYFDLDNYY